MGFPAQCLRPVQGPTPVKRQRQNSIIGNGFHLPMIVALFCLMPSLLQAKLVQPPVNYQELHLRERIAGTIWEPGRLDALLGLLGANDIVLDMQRLLAAFPVHESIWSGLQASLKDINLRQLQGFGAWAQGKGLGQEEWGPCPITRRHNWKPLQASVASVTQEHLPKGWITTCHWAWARTTTSARHSN